MSAKCTSVLSQHWRASAQIGVFRREGCYINARICRGNLGLRLTACCQATALKQPKRTGQDSLSGILHVTRMPTGACFLISMCHDVCTCVLAPCVYMWAFMYVFKHVCMYVHMHVCVGCHISQLLRATCTQSTSYSLKGL
jgi:hypothetical protein